MSKIDFQKVADAIEKAPKEARDLMFSTDLGEKIGEIAEKNNLEEEVVLNFFDEIGYVILGLKSRFEFSNSLIEIGLEKNTADLVAKEIESSVFVELDKIKNNAFKTKDEKVVENEKVGQTENREPAQINKNGVGVAPRSNSGVGQDFEKIILNQARAMQPARSVPDNLPIESKSGVVHDYKPNTDPYREPIE